MKKSAVFCFALILTCLINRLAFAAPPTVGPGYYVEAYVSGFQNVNAIAFSPGGEFGYDDQLFVGDSRPNPGTIYRVPAKDTREFFASANSIEPRSFEFSPGGSYWGTFLFVSDGYNITKFDNLGNRTTFASINAFGMDLVFSPNDLFRNHLYHADARGRAIWEWLPDGTYSNLVSGLPSDRVCGLALGPGGGFGNDLFVVFSPVESSSPGSIIRTVTPNGIMQDFLTSAQFSHTNQLAFDSTGNFRGNLFVSDRGNDTIFEIHPNKEIEVFASGFAFTSTPYHKSDGGDIVFGPDGAMYIADGGAGTVWRIAPIPGNLDYIEISGPDEIKEGAKGQYIAKAYYDDGTIVDITNHAEWTVEPNIYASISGNGLLSAGDIDEPRQRVTITAEYTSGDVTFTYEKEVTILGLCSEGYALEFDGLDDYVRVPRSNSLEPVDEITVELWADLDNEQKYHTRLVRKAGDFGNGYILAANQSFDKRMQLRIDFMKVIVADTEPLSAYIGQWHHFAGVYSASVAEFYVDGIKVSSVNHNAGNLTHNPLTDLFIGHGFVSGGEAFDGKIDEVRIWNTARTGEEIQGNMHSKLEGTETGLVAYWDFDEGFGQVVNDKSGFGNDGQLGSSPSEDASDPIWVISGAPVGICDNATIVDFDIKPGSCPNPMNVKSQGVVPVAILGSEAFDVNTIEAASIRLVGVAAIRNSYEDVAGPATDINDCNCTDAGPDGFTDLTLKFHTQEIFEAIGEVNHNDILTLEFTGMLFDGTSIEGADCVVIKGKRKPINTADISEDGKVDSIDFAIFAENWLQSSILEE